MKRTLLNLVLLPAILTATAKARFSQFVHAVPGLGKHTPSRRDSISPPPPCALAAAPNGSLTLACPNCADEKKLGVSVIMSGNRDIP